MSPEKLPNPAEFRRSAVMMQVGTDLIGPAVVGIVLDWLLGWTPWATVVGISLGFLLCLMHLWKLLNRINQGPTPGPPPNHSP